MPRVENYYSLSEAEHLRETYSCWLNKMAHAGNGNFNTLKRIIVRAKRNSRLLQPSDKMYLVLFEFENEIRLDAQLFLSNNGLTFPHNGEDEIIHTNKQQKPTLLHTDNEGRI